VADLEGNVGKTISRYHDHTILESDVPALVVALILVVAAGETCLPLSHQQHDTCHFARTSFRCRCKSYNAFTVVFFTVYIMSYNILPFNRCPSGWIKEMEQFETVESTEVSIHQPLA
jgi:hypothetical protein